jgi:hypothetical protein
MGGGRNCTLDRIAGEPISKWTCKCGRGYWDSGKQKDVLGGPIGRGEAATRAEYEAHKKDCATCRNQADVDDYNSLHGEPPRPLEPVCTVERRFTARQARREGWEASTESQKYGDLDAEQPARVDTRRHVPRDRMSPPTDSQWMYSDSRPRGAYFSGHGETPFYRLFPEEDTAQRTIATPYQPSTERLQDIRVPPRRPDTHRRDSEDDQNRGNIAKDRRNSGVDSRDRAVIQDISRHREPSSKAQIPPSQSSRLSTLARHFVELGLGRYSESARFISENPKLVARSEIDALVAEASIAERAGQSTMAQTCIHQALLLRKCQNLGLRGFDGFIWELERDSKAKDAFVRDVKAVYSSIQEQARKSLPQSQPAASEPYNRKAPIISQATGHTDPQGPSVYTQSLSEPTKAQTQVSRDRDGRLFYTDDQGRVLRPASSRHDPDRHRSLINPDQTTTQQYQGAASESYGRNLPIVSQTSERIAHVASRTSREVADSQRESPRGSEDISGGMTRLQINTDTGGDDQVTRADAENEIIDRLRRSGRSPPTRQEFERLVDEYINRFVGRRR